MFLNALGAKTFQLLSTLCTPAAPTSLMFNEIVQMLKQHLDPIPNIIAQQYKFGQCKQREGNSISEFVAALKALSVHAEFKCEACNANTAPTHLRTQLVIGIRDNDAVQQLLQQEVATLTFNKAVDMALTIEAAKKDSVQLKQAANVPVATVNRIHNEPQNSRTNQQGRSEQRGKTEFPSKVTTARDNSSSISANPVLRKCGIVKNQCLRCGELGHTRKQCSKSEGMTCTKCLNKGHMEVICISTMLKTSKASGKVNTIEWNTTEYADEFDYKFSLNSVDEKPAIHQIGNLNKLWMKVHLTLNIEEVPVKFKINCGCPITTISNMMFAKYFPDKKISKIQTVFDHCLGDEV